MTYNNIYEYFKDDTELLWYFDPLSTAVNNEQASLEIYHKLVGYSNDYRCEFVRVEHGYIFYAKPRWFFQKKMLISFCLKPEFRTAPYISDFWNQIRKNLGNHFVCYLYNRNTRAMNFLLRGGMKVKKLSGLITLLSI